MLTSEFDYYLPKELIAQFPPEERGQSRLLIYHRNTGLIEHCLFPDLVEYLRPTDIVVVNDSKVIPARLWATDLNTGKYIELLLIKPIEKDIWEVLTRPAKRCQPGVMLTIGNGKIQAKIIDKLSGSRRAVHFIYSGQWSNLLTELGEMPVPPYIKRSKGTVPSPAFEQLKEIDTHRYQTVYAKHDGSIAAPTAGLHFTEDLLQQIDEKGIKVVSVTLHVGPGTFLPIRTEKIADHKLEPEYYQVSQETAVAINTTKQNQGRVIAVGTTSTRTLETVTDNNGLVHPGEGWSGLFIYPGYRFKVIDGLLTNFHLPQSTLLMLVAAFVGREKILEIYQKAINRKYRFYSYGDATLIL